MHWQCIGSHWLRLCQSQAITEDICLDNLDLDTGLALDWLGLAWIGMDWNGVAGIGKLENCVGIKN